MHDLESQDEVEFKFGQNTSNSNGLSLFLKKTGKLLNKVQTNDFQTCISHVKNIATKSSDDKCVIIFVELCAKVCFFLSQFFD